MPKIIGPPRIPHGGRDLDVLVELMEALILKKVKAKFGRGRLNCRRIRKGNSSRAELLEKTAKDLHVNFLSLNNGRRSAACLFEALRLRLWLLTVVHRSLPSDATYLLTLADPKWSRPLEELSPDWHKPVLRKIRAAITKLRQAGHPVKGVVVIELCVDRDLKGNLSWSPHFHMVITGAEQQVLREAFNVRLPAGRRGIDKPLQVQLIKPGDLGRVLSYISKMKPELRSAYMTDEGLKRRRRNHLPKELLPDWLSVMADRPITELVVHFGQGPDIARRFRTADMSFILGELL